MAYNFAITSTNREYLQLGTIANQISQLISL